MIRRQHVASDTETDNTLRGCCSQRTSSALSEHALRSCFALFPFSHDLRYAHLSCSCCPQTSNPQTLQLRFGGIRFMDGKRGWRTPDEELSQALQHAPALLRQVTLPAAPPSSLRESDGLFGIRCQRSASGLSSARSSSAPLPKPKTLKPHTAKPIPNTYYFFYTQFLSLFCSARSWYAMLSAK